MRTLRGSGQLSDDDWQALDQVRFNLAFDRVLFVLLVRVRDIHVEAVWRGKDTSGIEHEQVATEDQNVSLALHDRALEHLEQVRHDIGRGCGLV